ncbi:MAG: hypothetical protein ACI9VR_003254 [Cognaticolwellia sp.]|jgi:hypothetical protein
MLTTLLLSASFLGCFPHKVRIESEPPGAQVQINRRKMGTTPVEFTVLTLPHLRTDSGCDAQRIKRRRCRFHVQVSLPGYRTLHTTIGQDARAWRHLLHPLRGGAWECLIPPFQWRGGKCVAPHSRREVVLVADHGPTGTWTPEDAKR